MRRIALLGAWKTVVTFFVLPFRSGSLGSNPAPYNILLITPDQLSADYMHTYRYPYPDTPNIDQLASEETVFTQMYDGAPWATPSFGVFLTGLFPTVHGMTRPPVRRLHTSSSVR